ncbi:hypothetical protein BCR34DRAFT_115028 [Clohesyomyces aquaticus]|uniref:Uncharacterized protein n=1 Tax=Clohesyomyces aquaticus TaxID=1231657 RepID=A0A1Y1YRY5_9PLEO|nr:hypothetical protein BCR34DRAFT_115028 [Clohesyomyces aquaticus]
MVHRSMIVLPYVISFPLISFFLSAARSYARNLFVDNTPGLMYPRRHICTPACLPACCPKEKYALLKQHTRTVIQNHPLNREFRGTTSSM